jgi:hypothetical protein
MMPPPLLFTAPLELPPELVDDEDDDVTVPDSEPLELVETVPDSDELADGVGELIVLEPEPEPVLSVPVISSADAVAATKSSKSAEAASL